MKYKLCARAIMQNTSERGGHYCRILHVQFAHLRMVLTVYLFLFMRRDALILSLRETIKTKLIFDISYQIPFPSVYML